MNSLPMQYRDLLIAHDQLRGLREDQRLTVERVDYFVSEVAIAHHALISQSRRTTQNSDSENQLHSDARVGYDLMAEAMLHAGETALDRLIDRQNMQDRQILLHVIERLKIWIDLAYREKMRDDFKTFGLR